ncbi:aminodeoxychorismate synthase component I [Congregibacter variabilis]|uniref:aminodeoxychorismate synthase n=1 Tax=Congregibacter variabilis TaxID=3081200 RepID=A0ABZ0I3H0_9GAMM|nr:aminodeoxychorismate synthase component I [Congregibacter sp. IMCC43200]
MTVRASKISHEALPLPYFDNPCAVYRRLRHLGQAVLLDSGSDSARARFDIVAAQADSSRSVYLAADTGEEELGNALQRWQAIAEDQITNDSGVGALPFYGGYIGHISYELGRRLQSLPATRDATLPIVVAHYYPWAIVQDRKEQRSWLVGETVTINAVRADLESLLSPRLAPPAPSRFQLLQKFAHRWSLSDYRNRFERVKDYIAAGDCYQINIGQPFTAPFAGDLFGAYETLRSIAKAPFSGFFPLNEDQSLLCLSPERFLTVDQGAVETRPIKGTRPRHKDPQQDELAAQALIASDKERAENLMIVDLLRNDLGRFCEPGSVRAQEMFALESYSTVHHLVSVVTARLSPKYSVLDLLLGCMPGGSITGAPKHRAMQIIDELEPAARQAWCGSLFYLSRHGRLDSNIAIRTLFNEGTQLHCWAGGGLVYDSQLEAEYQEQSDKVGAFLRGLEAVSKLTQ